MGYSREKLLEQSLAHRLLPDCEGPLWQSTYPGGKHTILERSYSFPSMRTWCVVHLCGLRPVNPTACLCSSFYMGVSLGARVYEAVGFL